MSEEKQELYLVQLIAYTYGYSKRDAEDNVSSRVFVVDESYDLKRTNMLHIENETQRLAEIERLKTELRKLDK